MSFPFPTCACATVLLCFDWQAESYLIISMSCYHSHHALPSLASCMCPLRPAGRGRVRWDIRWVIDQRANPSVPCCRDHSASMSEIFYIKITRIWIDLRSLHTESEFFRIRHPFLSKCLLRMWNCRKSNLIRILWRTKFWRQCVNVIETTWGRIYFLTVKISNSVCNDL